MASADVAPAERSALLELYELSNGSSWLRSDGWTTDMSVCGWHGVKCALSEPEDPPRAAVIELRLAANNLRGALPESLGELPLLSVLDLRDNHLTGPVPGALLERFDAHQMDLYLGGNGFSNLISRVRVEYDETAHLCSTQPGSEAHFIVEVADGADARMQSARCRSPEEPPYAHCEIRTGKAPSLLRLSRALALLDFASMRGAHGRYTRSPLIDPSAPPELRRYTMLDSFHPLELETTAWYGDGTRQTVHTKSDDSPMEVWLAQQLFIALVQQVAWGAPSVTPTCEALE